MRLGRGVAHLFHIDLHTYNSIRIPYCDCIALFSLFAHVVFQGHSGAGLHPGCSSKVSAAASGDPPLRGLSLFAFTTPKISHHSLFFSLFCCNRTLMRSPPPLPVGQCRTLGASNPPPLITFSAAGMPFTWQRGGRSVGPFQRRRSQNLLSFSRQRHTSFLLIFFLFST